MNSIKINNKKTAFTLAEILITMTLIGAIAALTIPSLNNNFRRHQYSTKLKNFVSRMDNAIEQMELEKGPVKNMKRPSNLNNAFNWYMENLDPYMGHQYVKTSNRTVYFKDGSSLAFSSIGWAVDINYDVNGSKKPNQYGRDKFAFLMVFEDERRLYYFCSKNISWGPYYEAQVKNKARASVYNYCKSTPRYCTQLLELDGWEFKKDYPYKI